MLRQITALFAALLIGIAVFAWVEGYSSSFQNCVREGGSHTATENSQNQKIPVPTFVLSYVRCTEKFADSHNSLITALGTVLLAVITLGLIWSGVDQQNTTRAQLRAYVMIDNVAITNVNDGGAPNALITLKNFGAPLRSQRAAADIPFLNDLYRSRADKAGIVYVDVWDGFVDEDGRFTPSGPDFEGQTRRLRTGDGVYFTHRQAQQRDQCRPCRPRN